MFFLLRVYWAFVGNKYSRQIFCLPVTNRTWWWGMLYEFKWYAFLVKDPKKYIGHNPLAHVAMFSFMLFLVFMMVQRHGAVFRRARASTAGNTGCSASCSRSSRTARTLHTLHHLGMWAIVVFVIVHIYAAVREDILSRQSMISSIVSGERLFRDDLPD